MKSISKLLALLVLCASIAFTACSNSASGVSSVIDRSGTALVTVLDGGTVAFNSELTLTVPEEAVAEDTTITVKRLSECPQKFDEGYTPFGQIYKFTPAGTSFSLDKPAVMELNYNETALIAAGLDPRTVTLFYYDEENENYVVVESSVDISRKQITANVEHFTIYIPMAKALLPGNNPPQVLLQNPVPNPIRAGAPVYIRATIRDNDADGSIASARVYFRKRNPVVDSWQSLPMKKEVRPNTFDTYAAIIPASYLTAANIGAGNDLEIYVIAFDNLGASTQSATRGYNVTRTYNAGSITITPTSLTIASGFERLFTVRGRDSSGANFQFIPENFSLSNDLGPLKNWGTQGIHFKAQKKGTGTLTVSDGTNSAVASITVKNGDLASISIRDTNGQPISGTLTFATGVTYDFDVVGYDEFNNTVLVNPVWSVDASIGTIDQTGRLTVGTGSGTTGNVTVTLGDLTATQQVKKISTEKNMLTFSIGGYTGIISAPFITLTNYGTSNLNGLVAEFTTNGARVEVGGVVQTSGTTTNDFRTSVVYTVFAEDGSSQDYTVTVLIGVTGVTLNQSSITINTGNTVQLLATIAPANVSNMAVIWSTSDPLVATVDGTGKVIGVAPGSTTITVTTVDGGRTASCTVNVNLLPSTIVFADGTSVSKHISSGAYTNIVSGDGIGTITYTSGTPATATVNAATGEVTVLAVGTTVITAVKAATAAHETVTNSYTLTVTLTMLYSIGDIGPSGVGIVFYVTDGGLHGLEAVPSGWNGGSADPSSQWKFSNTSTPGTLTAIGTGHANTYSYLTGAEHPAASLCRAYNGGDKTDWFLPSKDELNQLYLQKSRVGSFAADYYWSSSQDHSSPYGDSYTFTQNFSNGRQSNVYFWRYDSLYVRAVRAF